MKQINRILLTACMATVAYGASAQALRSAYFSDSYIFRHHLNPALANEDGYFTMPGLGNTGIDMGMNFGIGDFIKPGPNGNLVTSLHPSITDSEFLDGLEDKLQLQQQIDLTVFGFGWNALGGYNTFDASIHEITHFQMPKGLFAFMKQMNPDTDYDFSDLHLQGRAWAEVALGHSHPIGENWRVGAKLKLLVGLGYAKADIEDTHARFGEDKWQMRLKGNMVMGLNGTGFKSNEYGRVDGIGSYKKGPAGYGYGIDLGVTYDMQEVVDGLKVSTSILDLGSITWYDCAFAANEGEVFTFDGFNNLGMHNEAGHQEGSHTGSLNNQWDDINKDLNEMLNLKIGRHEDVKETLASTLTIGAEYELPMYKKVSFGILYTQRFSDVYDFSEVRAVANYAPSRVFDMSVTGAANTWGTSLGGVLNVHVPGLNLFVGTDYLYIGTKNKNMIPLEKSGMNIQFGINIPFGRPAEED